ncbi:response regulator [Aestuariibius sp. HNIBRBA575]|uniref:response regulator transcription factor n=1 Tax=Aestuariibius sp. HNIBRBA575 TaxID=3233343 RepID=UPI0034A41AF0
MPTILIADDHDLVRDTIAAYLGKSDDFSIQTASTLPEAVGILRGMTSFDLAILDYNMPGMDGLAGLEQAIAEFPVTKFALMSGVAKAEVAREAMTIGAMGFFPKSLTADTMVNAIRFLLSGEKYFPFDLALVPENESKGTDFYGLSPREAQTLRGLCDGKSNKEIGRDLDLQEVTIKLHVKNILRKLDVKNRTQAALLAQTDGFR